MQDAHSEERIPFASVQFKHTTVGALTDVNGNFSFTLNNWPSDTLIVTYVGYEDFLLPIDSTIEEMEVVIDMERKRTTEVVIKSKVGKGVIMWRRIVKNKPLNDRGRFDNYSYEIYNKLEADLNDAANNKLIKLKVLKPFREVIDQNIDSVTEEKPILPLYLTESLSDYYYQSKPRKVREVFKGVKTIGINNQSISKMLGGMYQNINVYKNFIPVFDKDFVSPISDNGSAYYHYTVPDTQTIDGRKFFHFVFSPKYEGENAFTGDAWIADSSYAVMKMTLRVPDAANLNFVEKLDMVQEYSLLNDSTWFLSKDKFVADFIFLDKNRLNFIGRKTSTYRNVIINDTTVERELMKNKLREETVMNDSVNRKSDEYWADARHEELSTSEKGIYQMIDTLMAMPSFKRFTDLLYFLGTGYKNVGNYEIGPWYNWFTINAYEGPRVRFDLGTNTGFHKKLYFTGYLAYGFADQKLKGRFQTLYLFNKSPRSTIMGSFLNDIDNGQVYYDEVGSDNLFAIALRKPNVPLRYMKIQQQRVEYFKEWLNGFSVTLNTQRRRFTPLSNLPLKDHYPAYDGGESMNSFEAGIKVRFAYLEKFLDGNFYRMSLGSSYPIVEAHYSKGIKGILRSNYNFHRVGGSISDYKKISPYGSIYYNTYAGKIYGKLPYTLLEMPPGNNIWYYNKYAFNMMTRYEYLADWYAGINVEHNIGNGLFRFIPLTRTLKFRQFWGAKVFWSGLSEENKLYNAGNNGHAFKTMDGKPYMEIGTGVDNIFKIFRVDFIWRVLPRPLPDKTFERFGIFGSFRIVF
ncbi:MAG: carboxypeptidase-like regulatory domain-containing protein [Chitinophagaceae bacterium]|nr:carboxypeptidase-like regulatory domain-containing protein [Chitinophagaceae bacterium]MCW5928793.1 carboxypeptidase-like regulatory domain-containing protein [Chitinophagaceae bacterium]